MQAAIRAGNSLTLTRLVYSRLDELARALNLDQRFEHLNRGYAGGGADPNADPGEHLLWALLGETRLDGRHVLDAGCGRGGALAAIGRAHAPAALTGVDVSPEQIAACRRSHPALKARWQVADICSLPQGDASQDVVLVLEVLSGVHAPAGFARSAARVLRRGGMLLIGDQLAPAVAARMVEQLSRSGFSLHSFTDLSQGVLAAMAAHGPDAAPGTARSEENFLRSVLGDELAAQQAALASGALCYGAWRFERNGEPAVPGPDWSLADAGSAEAAPAFRKALIAEPVGTVFPYGAPQPGGALPVFAFPFAGGGASVFRGWSQELAAGMQFCPVQLPGREGFRMESPLRSMAESVAWARTQIEPWLEADQPFALYGHCQGGLLAYELAVALSAAGRAPAALWLSAAHPPHLPVAASLLDLLQVARIDGADLPALLALLGGTPPDVLAAPSLMRMLEQTMRADFAVGATYRRTVRATVPCPIHAVAGLRDKLVPALHMRGWSACTDAGFSTETLDGEHFFVRERRAEVMAALLRQAAALALAQPVA